LYSAVLEYLGEVHHYFSQKTIARVVKSVIRLEDLTTKFTTKIKNKSNEVDEYVRLVSGEVLGQTNSKIGMVEGTVTTIALRLRKLDGIDERSDRVQGLLEDEIRKLGEMLTNWNVPIARIATKISSIDDDLKDSQRLKIFEWLSTIPYTSHHRSKEKILMPGSGTWLIGKPEFIEWMDSSTSSILWLHGIPGSGKSMLVARVIQYLQSQMPEADGQAPLAYFYCARTANEPERSDPVELLRSIIEQLSCYDEESPIRPPVVDIYLTKKKEARGRKPDKLYLEDCVKVLLALLETNPATIVIDGLDECDPTRRQDVLDALQDVMKESNNVVKVFVSSRDDHDLVHRLSQTPNLYIEAADNMSDIREFVISSVDEAIRKERILCGRVPWDLKQTILDTLISRAHGMFRLVSLHVESLCNPYRIKTRANILDSLAHLPTDLKVSYDTILTQIQNTQYPNPLLAERVLKWLLCAREPLRSKTFLVAICSDMADQDLLHRSDILSICCNLVVYDGETESFRFAHLSVREHLEGLEQYSTVNANALAAEQCLSWFFTIEKYDAARNFLIVFEDTCDVESVPFCAEVRAGQISLDDLHMFWSHADANWGRYARFAGPMREHGRLKALLQRFLLSPQRQGLAGWVHRVRDYKYLIGDPEFLPDDDNSFFYEHLSPDPLFVACTFNLSEIVKALVSNTTWNPHCGQTAAAYNSTGALKAIFDALQEGQNFQDSYLHSLVIEAASVGSIESLSEILTRGKNNMIGTEDLCGLIRELDRRRKQLQRPVLKSLMNANSALRITESVFEAAFECQTNVPFKLGSLTTLLAYSEGVELTQKLIETAKCNRMDTDNIMLQVLRHNGPLYISPTVLSLMIFQRRSSWTSAMLDRWKELTQGLETALGSRIVLRMFNVLEIIRKADTLNLEVKEDILNIITRNMDQGLELSWADISMLNERKSATNYLLLLLQGEATISESAVGRLVASWDAGMVKVVLRFQRINITDRIIRAAARNLKHGEEIMKILLEKEAEKMDVDIDG
jgi:nucleoside-triphosphatase THEP1